MRLVDEVSSPATPPWGMHSRDSVVRIGIGPTDLDRTILRLAQFPKPVTCTASVDVNNQIVVACILINDPGLRHVMSDRPRTGESWARRIHDEYQARESDPLISVRSKYDTVTMPLSGLRAYFDEYLILGSLTLDRPDVEAQAAGASAVVRLTLERPSKAAPLASQGDLTSDLDRLLRSLLRGWSLPPGAHVAVTNAQSFMLASC